MLKVSNETPGEHFIEIIHQGHVAEILKFLRLQFNSFRRRFFALPYLHLHQGQSPEDSVKY